MLLAEPQGGKIGSMSLLRRGDKQVKPCLFVRGLFVGLLLLIGLGLALAAPVWAAGGIGISGTFSGQVFQIPQGSEVNVPSVYVLVFNQGEEEFGVKMTCEPPFGVEVSFSDADFHLEPGAQKKVFIGVKVSQDAVPGEYEISVSAECQRDTEGSGIQVLAAAAQRAKLVVLGEAAWVNVQVTSPDGDPVVAQVRLFKWIEGRSYEFARSDTGTLEAKISPGLYSASAYIAGNKLAEESFDIKANEKKSVTLTVKTVYFEGFGIVRNYYKETGELAFAQVVYTINNLYQPMADVEVVLQVRLDGKPLEEISLTSLSELSLGRMGGSYNYIPAEGWKGGTYSFKLELFVEGKLYTTSLEEELDTGLPPPGAPAVSWAVLAMIIGGVVVIIGVVVAVILLRRRRASGGA